MPSNSEILELAPGASYLAANAIRKSALFDKGRLNPILNQQIYAIYFITKKIYDLNPDYPGMTAVCLYLWEIMGRYGIAAQGLTGGGGSVTPITPPPSGLNPISFVVSGSSPIVTGDNILVISSYIGYNVIFNRNNIPQSQTNNGGTYFTWDTTTGTFACIGVAAEDELFDIYPTI